MQARLQDTLLLHASSLPLKRCSVRASVRNFTALVQYSHIFEAEEVVTSSEELEEAVFQLVGPDCGALSSFSVLIDGNPANPAHSTIISEGAHSSTHMPLLIAAPNACTAVIRHLKKKSRVELALTFVTDLVLDGPSFLLAFPPILVPSLSLTGDHALMTAGALYRAPALTIDFDLDIQLSLCAPIIQITSPTYPVAVSHPSPAEASLEGLTEHDSRHLAKVSLAQSSPRSCAPLTTLNNVVLQVQLDLPTSSFPLVFVEECSETMCAQVLMRPSISPTPLPASEVLIVVDTAHLPLEGIPKAVRAAIKNELSNSTQRIFLNVVLLTKSGPQFALPKTTQVTQDVLHKVYLAIDGWHQLIKKQGIRVQNYVNSLQACLATTLSRPIGSLDAPRHVILIANILSSKYTKLEQLMATCSAVVVHTMGMGAAQNVFALRSLASACHGRAEHAWDLNTFMPKLAHQIRRARHAFIPAGQVTILDKNDSSATWAPSPLPALYPEDLVYLYGLCQEDSLLSDKTHIELSSRDFQFFADSASPRASVDWLSAQPCDDGMLHLLAITDRLLDIEEDSLESRKWTRLFPGLYPPIQSLQLYSETIFPSGEEVCLFSIPEDLSRHEDEDQGDENEVVIDLDTLLSYKGASERPPGLPNILGVTSDATPSGRPTPRRKTNSKSRPALAIQGVWESFELTLPPQSGDGTSVPRVDKVAQTSSPIDAGEASTGGGAAASGTNAPPEPSKPAAYYASWFKTMNSMLNKLTKDNFERLAAKILAEVLKEMGDLYVLAHFDSLLYDKAIRQPTYSSMYADLVRYLMEETAGHSDYIRRFLLEKCHAEFQHLLLLPTDPLPSNTSFGASSSTDSSYSNTEGRPVFYNSKQASSSSSTRYSSDSVSSSTTMSEAARLAALTEDEEEKENKARELRLGLITFLAKLYKKGIINIEITQSCIGELLTRGMQDQEKHGSKKRVECLTLAARYLLLVGKYLHQAHPAVIEKFFSFIDAEILHNPAVDSRAHYLFLNLIELKQNHWIPRDSQSEPDPQTLSDIRKSTGIRHSRS